MKINIIYASTSGNVEVVCEKVCEVLSNLGHETLLHRAEQTKIEALLNSDFLILATSTWEHGELNPFFKLLYDEMGKHDLTGLKAAFVGLGDKRYEPVLFAEGMETVRRRFLKQGGQEVGEALRINGEPYSLLETEVVQWVNQLTDKI